MARASRRAASRSNPSSGARTTCSGCATASRPPPRPHPDPIQPLTVQPPDAPAVTLRPATSADLPALGRLGALLVRTHHDFDPLRFIAAIPQTEEAYASFLGSQLRKPDVVILVAERDGEIIGYTFAGIEGHDYMALRGPAGALYDIVVDPAQRGRGIGRMLLDA